MTYIPDALRQQIEQRANSCCEYCLLPAAVSFYVHEVDHVIALKHGGQTSSDNLAYACWRCNRHKGTDLGSFDPQTQEFAFLFNPRLQIWSEHFAIENEQILGQTPSGRATVHLLQFNTNERISERQRAAKLNS
ncbi:HNH endonuclease signature motif containing protein [Rivularia sp. UHCC 0363]|uniref:HNH endonuclease n=1 Tax=Rivularia sp. UHCC 0363 TaxID=3110244 RepID=UPI002B1F2DFD|nr:HNH endonuclease signature motif containing protein [Rivularia sp. UHCC 0363]MEA5597377.1 HNH endonuclease signature motif containing protein [Rivularia sp. UHCC 0363]